MAKHKNVSVKSWTCKVCGQKCQSMGNLKSHYAKHPEHHPARHADTARRAKAAKRAQTPTRRKPRKKPTLSVNFCPNCGCPIDLFGEALRSAPRGR